MDKFDEGEPERPAGSAPEVHRLLSADRAAQRAGESAARWWRDLANAANVAITDQALDALFRDALFTMAEALGAEEVSVLVANEAATELVARASVGLSEELSLGLRIPAGEGMAGRVLANRQTLVVHDLSQFTVVSRALPERGFRSVVAVPMIVGDRVIGVFLHAGSRRVSQFTASDADVLEVLADRLAAALDRVRLFETERTARRLAERMTARLRYMQEITAALAGTSRVEEVVAVLLEWTNKAGACSSSIWRVYQDRLVYDQGHLVGAKPEDIALDGTSPIGLAARDGAPVYVASRAQAAERFGDLAGLALEGESFAFLPVRARGRCLGVVCLGYPSDAGLDPDEGQLLVSIVEQAAQALDRAELQELQIKVFEINAFMSRAAKVMAEAETSGFAGTLDSLATLAMPVLGDICLIDILGDDARIRRLIAKHRDPSRQHLVDRLKDYEPRPSGAHPAIGVIGNGQTRWASHMSDAFLRATTLNEDHFALTKRLGFLSYVAVPLVTEERTIGALTFVSTGRRIGAQDVSFAEMLAGQVAIVVENARQFESTYRTSKSLQEGLLPKHLPKVPGLIVENRYLASSRGLDVGGDFYDVVVLPSGNISFMIGDVEGHDRDAAALMGQLRSAARALVGQSLGPDELITALRNSWGLLGFERSATALFGEIDPSTGDLVMASAGHLPPLLIAERSARYLPVAPAPPFGAPSAPAGAWRGNLGQGEVLLLYTDGLIDERRDGTEGGMRIIAEIASAGAVAPDVICDRIIDAVMPDRADDVALLALQREPHLG
jgi:serine/threonine-protein kinase RsbW